MRSLQVHQFVHPGVLLPRFSLTLCYHGVIENANVIFNTTPQHVHRFSSQRRRRSSVLRWSRDRIRGKAASRRFWPKMYRPRALLKPAAQLVQIPLPAPPATPPGPCAAGTASGPGSPLPRPSPPAAPGAGAPRPPRSWSRPSSKSSRRSSPASAASITRTARCPPSSLGHLPEPAGQLVQLAQLLVHPGNGAHRGGQVHRHHGGKQPPAAPIPPGAAAPGCPTTTAGWRDFHHKQAGRPPHIREKRRQI